MKKLKQLCLMVTLIACTLAIGAPVSNARDHDVGTIPKIEKPSIVKEKMETATSILNLTGASPQVSQDVGSTPTVRSGSYAVTVTEAEFQEVIYSFKAPKPDYGHYLRWLPGKLQRRSRNIIRPPNNDGYNIIT
jgi:hypothetical protein